MEKLAKIGHYFNWIKKNNKNHEKKDQKINKTKNFTEFLKSIILWENSSNSLSVIVTFNTIFWAIVVLEVQPFAAASSAALVGILTFSFLEINVEQQQDNSAFTIPQQSSREQFDKIINKIKLGIDNLKNLQKKQPRIFCTGVCIVSILLWLIGRAINGVLIVYVLCMCVFLGPALLLRIPIKLLSTKEWETEIDDFLPAATEDNLEVLKRAGETGDQSPTSQSNSQDFQNDAFNDDELNELKMPSHDDGSTDGLELSDHEFGDTDVDGIKIKSGHFERCSSSSDDDAELEPQDSVNSHSCDDESDSEFEIIDSHEIDSNEIINSNINKV